MNEAQLRSCYKGLKGIQDELECYEVVRAVQEYRYYWRPKTVRVVLLAESHVFTTKEEHLVRLSARHLLPANYPDGYVRFVYCLGYGEQDLVDDSVKQNPGTWQYWKLFKSCLHRASNNEDFAPVLKGGTRNFTERLCNKLCVLETMRRRGIWLVDASIVGLYAPGGRRRLNTNEKVKVIQHCWDHYIADVLAETSPRFIICVGIGVGNALRLRLDKKYGRNLEILRQPNARGIPPDERLKSFQKYFEICKQHAP